MDLKAAAMSKRSQSHQGKRNHPTPSAAAAHKKKEALPQPNQARHGGAQSSRRHLRNLPSNWDRYEDEDDVVEVKEGRSETVRRDAREPAAKAMRPLAGGGDALAPKSKGADFRYLVEQARSEARDRGYGESVLASSSLSDETLPEFTQGLMSIISAKGESLLSWCTDDNFAVDNDAGSSFEVPFLSMDINALAAQLSKLNVSQRLFVEEDILPIEMVSVALLGASGWEITGAQPPLLQSSLLHSGKGDMDMHADRLNENDVQRFHHVKAQNICEDKHCLDEDALPGAENLQVSDGQNKPRQSKALEQNDVQRSGRGVSPLSSWGQGLKQDLLNSLESLERESQRHSRDSGSNIGIITVQDSATKFEAAAAEEELDKLLDSFGGINEFASSASSSSTYATHNAPDRMVHTDVVPSMQESSFSSKTDAGAFFDDTVDDILAERQASSSPGICMDINNNSRTQLKPHGLSTGVYEGSSMGFSDSRHTASEKSIDGLLAKTNFFYSSAINVQRKNRRHGSSVHVDAPHQMEDHDSRHAASTIPLDETIDDLLAETSSYLKNPEPSPHPQGKTQKPSVNPTASKALEDIDTWLDLF
ncbi:hypothetical protein Taro_003741 [Colocasia esculenta]|uniref:Uncharacterized protein n=1 Tax=Colocasia esculenta TaxID=4460 RepID=A0A843TPQ0_COLES|nr:hypothetical protein [Colocasia esculenta]